VTSPVQPDSAAVVAPERLRDDADFRRYWWSRLLSIAGSIVSYVALPVLVYRLSGSAVLTASVTALETASYVLFGLFAGALSDRWDRRVVMVYAELVDAAAMASVPIAHWLGILTIAQLMIVAFFVPTVAVFFDGANFGALPLLVGRERIAQANAAVFGAATSAEIVLPSLVGVGLAVLHPATMLAVDAVSYLASAWCIATISKPMYDRSRTHPALTVRALAAEIVEGLRFLVAHPGVRTMTIVGALQSTAGYGFVALMVVWCDQTLDVGSAGLRFGLVYGSWSVGGLLASIALPRLLRTTTPARITLLALPVSALIGIVTAVTTDWVLAALCLFAWSCAYTLVVVNSISYRQQVTPERLLSRVNTAGRMLAWGVGGTVGALGAGLLGHLFGIRPAIVAMSSLTLVGVAVAWWSPLRDVAAPPLDPQAEAAPAES
jgi:MFS family permease